MPKLHALLLTDVVDSTRLTEQLGDASMAEIWTAHDRVARDLLPTWRGREIDKTDGMLLLFDAVHDAVGYALAYHRSLAAADLPIRARAGIHVGPITLRPNPPDDIARGAKPVEVDGLALPIAARVMSVATGGQTLLSSDARLALGVAPQRVLSHGHWRMHGVADPVELFEVGDAEAPFAAPPDGAKVYRVMRQGDLWQPVREVRHSVPAERDSFVGRQEPLQLIARKLDDGARLISVLGIGGTGKTRLVTRFAWTRLGDYPGGVWFCDLSQARTLDGIHFAVAQGLDVPLGKTDPVVQLAHAIAGRGECLVIFDNFEQVARHAEETLGRWLERAPQARFIVTTREVLGIVGEETLALAPLGSSDATALFLRRAESTLENYAPNGNDLILIAQLVKVLDGLPLAIELAAARVRVMPPRQLLARMHERFSVLLSRSGRIDRQATLRAAFDWSWELLSDSEKRTLAQLSVFEGGFDLESAMDIVDMSGSMAGTSGPADFVQWLVDKSFVRQVSDCRFDLLESVRDYAAEHLRTEGRYPGSGTDAMQQAQRRHFIYFGSATGRRVVADSTEANNLVVACRRAVNAGDAASAAGAALGAWEVLKLSGPATVAAGLAEAVMSMAALSSRQRTMVEWVAGSAMHLLGRTLEARKYITAGLARAHAGGESDLIAALSCAMAEQMAEVGRTSEAQSQLTESLRLARELNDRVLMRRALNGLGGLLVELGQTAAADERYREALTTAQLDGDLRWQGGLLGNLGSLHHGMGHRDTAHDFYTQALELAARTGDRRWEGNTRSNLGLLLCEQSRFDEGHAQLQAARSISREVGHPRLECIVLCNLGLLDESRSNFSAAKGQYESAIAIASSLGDKRSEGLFRIHLASVLLKLGSTTSARQCLEAGKRLLVAVGDRVSLGQLICKVAELEKSEGNDDQADLALQEARTIAKEMQALRDSELCRCIDTTATLIEP